MYFVLFIGEKKNAAKPVLYGNGEGMEEVWDGALHLLHVKEEKNSSIRGKNLLVSIGASWTNLENNVAQ